MKTGGDKMKLYFRIRFVNCGNLFHLLLLTVSSLFLSACATVTHFPAGMAKQVRLTPAQAAAIIQKNTRASSSDADYGTFVVDEKGFSFAKTEKVEEVQTIDGVETTVEYEQTQVYHVAWQSINRIDPYLKQTFIGDLYGVRLLFLTSRVVFAQRMDFSTELDLYCSNYEELSYVVAALQTLMKK